MGRAGEGVERPAYRLRLFVSGATPRSVRAIGDVKAICETHLQGRYDLDVIDAYQHAELSARERLIALPTLLKDQPPPARRLAGADLADKDLILKCLGLLGDAPKAAP